MKPIGRLTPSELYGVTEARACLISDEDLSKAEDEAPRVPYVEFDAKNQRELPCNRIVRELGSTRLDFPVPIVPLKGCLIQREAGLCPRGLGPERTR